MAAFLALTFQPSELTSHKLCIKNRFVHSIASTGYRGRKLASPHDCCRLDESGRQIAAEKALWQAGSGAYDRAISNAKPARKLPISLASLAASEFPRDLTNPRPS